MLNDPQSPNRFAFFAWSVLAFNILVIIWGAFVRATGSGAGCGSNWPLCGGEFVPRAAGIQTLIEFSHRVTSGFALISVVVLVIWALRRYPARHRVRRAAYASLFFMIVEALIGAGLVLFEYVAFNVSVARAFWMAGHLINTFFLLAALALTAWWASAGAGVRLRGQGTVMWALLAACMGMLALGVSGGITALGDTLHLAGGISTKDSTIVAGLVDLRIYHPLIALGVGALVLGAVWLAATRRPDGPTRRLAQTVTVLYGTQLLLGSLNVALKAPVWLQLVHLLVTTMIWVLLVLLAAAALAVTQPQHETDLAAQPQTGAL